MSCSRFLHAVPYCSSLNAFTRPPLDSSPTVLGALRASPIDCCDGCEGIDALGLDDLDRSYLAIIGTTYRCGPVGLETIAATMNEDAGTLEDVVEPFLLQIGFLARTRRGRALTKAAADHLGLSFIPVEDNPALF